MKCGNEQKHISAHNVNKTKNLLRKFRVDLLLHKESYVHIKELCLFYRGGYMCLVPFLPNLRLDFDKDPMFWAFMVFQSENQKVSMKELSNWHTQSVHIDLQSLKENSTPKQRDEFSYLISNVGKNHWRVYEKQSIE